MWGGGRDQASEFVFASGACAMVPSAQICPTTFVRVASFHSGCMWFLCDWTKKAKIVRASPQGFDLISAPFTDQENSLNFS